MSGRRPQSERYDDRASARPGRRRRPSPPTARSEGRLALDTEFVWERTYSPVPCLLQLATVAAARGARPARGRRRRPDRRARRRPGRAARHARAGGRPAAVRDALRRARHQRVRHAARGRASSATASRWPTTGSSSARSASRSTHNETFSDWSRRPLTEAQIAYAADDVRYLFDARRRAARAQLDEMGRRSWAEDEIARRYGPAATIEPDPQRAYLKVARRGRLSGRQLAALRAVAAWREEEARTRDLPPGWVLKDPSVVEVARRNPPDAAALGRLRGLGSLSAPAAQRLLDALAGAADAEPRAGPPASCPRASRAASPPPRRSAPCSCARAAREPHIAPELVATRAELESFVEAMANGQDEHALLVGLAARAGGRRAPRARAGERRARARSAGAVRAHDARCRRANSEAARGAARPLVLSSRGAARVGVCATCRDVVDRSRPSPPPNLRSTGRGCRASIATVLISVAVSRAARPRDRPRGPRRRRRRGPPLPGERLQRRRLDGLGQLLVRGPLRRRQLQPALLPAGRDASAWSRSRCSPTTASAGLFAVIVMHQWGRPARWSALLFALSAPALLAAGQYPFALGTAFSLLALLAAQRDRPWLLVGGRARDGALEPARVRVPRRHARRPAARRRPGEHAAQRERGAAALRDPAHARRPRSRSTRRSRAAGRSRIRRPT